MAITVFDALTSNPTLADAQSFVILGFGPTPPTGLIQAQNTDDFLRFGVALGQALHAQYGTQDGLQAFLLMMSTVLRAFILGDQDDASV
ncbi:hypothetical protein [Sulfobacillus thermosulfidooxidans]|uniref:hypothetical protein n=1 Tax=Sulfobacillus thermosulfidooxidans TaxID=28034 RepID=UPI0006B6846D|nr:hypothetical protein [Sulfobacillus thermosulfidooxidans]